MAEQNRRPEGCDEGGRLSFPLLSGAGTGRAPRLRGEEAGNAPALTEGNLPRKPLQLLPVRRSQDIILEDHES